MLLSEIIVERLQQQWVALVYTVASASWASFRLHWRRLHWSWRRWQWNAASAKGPIVPQTTCLLIAIHHGLNVILGATVPSRPRVSVLKLVVVVVEVLFGFFSCPLGHAFWWRLLHSDALRHCVLGNQNSSALLVLRWLPFTLRRVNHDDATFAYCHLATRNRRILRRPCLFSHLQEHAPRFRVRSRLVLDKNKLRRSDRRLRWFRARLSQLSLRLSLPWRWLASAWWRATCSTDQCGMTALNECRCLGQLASFVDHPDVLVNIHPRRELRKDIRFRLRRRWRRWR